MKGEHSALAYAKVKQIRCETRFWQVFGIIRDCKFEYTLGHPLENSLEFTFTDSKLHNTFIHSFCKAAEVAKFTSQKADKNDINYTKSALFWTYIC